MIAKLGNPKIFADVIGIISELVSEVKIKVTKEGMSIIAIDPANVAMIVFKLPASAFSQLEVDDESLGLNLESFKAVLRRASFSSSLLMKTEENTLKIEIIDRIKREFSLSLIDLEKKDRSVPNLEFTSRVEINSIDFMEAVEDCSIVADSCTFETNPEGFSIYARGALNSAKLAYSSDEAYIESPTPAKSKYSLEYLQKMIRAAKLSDKTSINFSTNYPLRIDFKTPLLELSFILAQRVESED
jgi:proliferating cell nuclear antigen